LEGGINLFLYVAGNPVNKSDPLGLQESEFRPHPGYSDPPVSDDVFWGAAFPDPDSMAEGWRHGWESGYYKCLRNCLTKGSLPPVITTLIKEAIIKGAEHTAPVLAGAIYYMKYPKWFKALGKYSEVYVPRLAGRIQSVAKGVSVVGWFIFYGEIYHCAQKCSNECL